MNAESFKDLVMPMRDLMYQVAFRIVGNEADAMDAIQDTLMRLWDNRLSLARADDRKAYCLGALKNQCISTLRRRHERISIDFAQNLTDCNSASRSIEARDSIRLLQQIIHQLPDGQRRVIELSFFAHCSNDDIIRITGYSPQNVRTLLSRGRRKIKELFTLHSPTK